MIPWKSREGQRGTRNQGKGKTNIQMHYQFGPCNRCCLILPELSEETPAWCLLRTTSLNYSRGKYLSVNICPCLIKHGPVVLTFLNCTFVIAQLLGRKAMINLDSILKSRHYFIKKNPSCQSYGFSSSHVWMWELDYKEGWVLSNWCFWTVVLEKTLESPLDCKEIQWVHPKGDQSWIFIGRNDAEAEAPILWSSDAKSWLIGKDSDAGKDWRQEEEGMTKDEMVGWHHRLNGHEFG